MSETCGHLDFYPNNGKEQPGCDLTETPLPLTLIKEGIEEAGRVLVACNHVRAIKLFTESINSKCPYVAHRCPSYQHFMQGRCFSCGDNGTGCALMGLEAQKTNHPPGSKYYITTGKEMPFCSEFQYAPLTSKENYHNIICRIFENGSFYLKSFLWCQPQFLDLIWRVIKNNIWFKTKSLLRSISNKNISIQWAYL